MNQRLSWEEIKKQYNQQWIELIDYDWPEEDAYPTAGIVRVHAHSRKEFDQLAAIDRPKDSAFVYVGRQDLPPNTILSTFRILEVG